MIADRPPGTPLHPQELLLDGVTPIAAYDALRGTQPGPSFLFESAPGAGELARFSVIGLGVVGELVASSAGVVLETPSGKRAFEATEVMDAARRLLADCKAALADARPHPLLGAYGVASFEFAGLLERLPQLARSEPGAPELHLVVPAYVVVFDHHTHLVTVVSLCDGPDAERVRGDVVERLGGARIAPLQRPAGARDLRPRSGCAAFLSGVEAAKAAIREGEVFQVVLSQTWEARVEGDAFGVYRHLRSINPSPYMFYLELDGRVLLGSSPEMLCKLDGQRARLRPLAGTRARPARADQEQNVERKLRRDPKERAEHVMLVDLGRNDLGRVCEYGSVKVTELLAVERYSHVMHLVSEVQGRLRSDRDAFDLFAATFPAGTVSGAPKIRAMELIAQIEGRRRESYGGSVVRFGFDGSLDACIVLRSAEVRDGVAVVSTGAGIVADSVPKGEDAECRAKAMALARALGSTGAVAP